MPADILNKDFRYKYFTRRRYIEANLKGSCGLKKSFGNKSEKLKLSVLFPARAQTRLSITVNCLQLNWNTNTSAATIYYLQRAVAQALSSPWSFRGYSSLVRGQPFATFLPSEHKCSVKIPHQ